MAQGLLVSARTAAQAEDGPALLKLLETAAAFLAPPCQNGVPGSAALEWDARVQGAPREEAGHRHDGRGRGVDSAEGAPGERGVHLGGAEGRSAGGDEIIYGESCT